MLDDKINILFDISILGDGKKAGIYRVIENLIYQMQKYSNYNIYFCTSSANYRLCKKYLKNNPALNDKMFVYPKIKNIFSVIIMTCLIMSNMFFNIFNIFAEIFFKIKVFQYLFKFFARIMSSFKTLFLLSYMWMEKNRVIPKNFIKTIDIYFSPFHPFPNQILSNSRIKRFVIIHDLIALLYPEYFFYRFTPPLKKLISNLNENDNIICVSESTKRDLLNYRKDLQDNNIIVSHLAVADEINKVKDFNLIKHIKCRYKIDEKSNYILSVSTLEPRKNLVRIIKNFISLCDEGKINDTYLVLVGRKGWKYDVIFDEWANDSRYVNKIIFTGYVKDEDMSALMSGCLYFIYISLYEGFGLPPLEAMKCGAPVITSNNSSLPEVVGNSAITVDPSNDEEISAAMFKLYNDKDLRNSLSGKSIIQASQFSWERTSERIMNFMKEVMEK